MSVKMNENKNKKYIYDGFTRNFANEKLFSIYYINFLY